MDRLTEPTIGCFLYQLKDHKAVPGEFGTYEAFFDYSMAVRKLGQYEETGLTPEEVTAAKLALMGKSVAEIKEFDGLTIDRLQELAEADRDGRIRIMPKSEDATCGSCDHFKRIAGTRRGTCDIRPFPANKWGCAQPERGTFEPSQSRKCCKQYSRREETEVQESE